MCVCATSERSKALSNASRELAQHQRPGRGERRVRPARGCGPQTVVPLGAWRRVVVVPRVWDRHNASAHPHPHQALTRPHSPNGRHDHRQRLRRRRAAARDDHAPHRARPLRRAGPRRGPHRVAQQRGCAHRQQRGPHRPGGACPPRSASGASGRRTRRSRLRARRRGFSRMQSTVPRQRRQLRRSAGADTRFGQPARVGGARARSQGLRLSRA